MESEKINQKNKEFLTNQRRDDRVDFISEIERYFERIDREENEKKELMAQRLKKSQMDID